MKNIDIMMIRRIFKMRARGYRLREIAKLTELSPQGVNNTLNSTIKIVEDFKRSDYKVNKK